VKKGRHRRYEEARALKRGPDLDIEAIFTDLEADRPAAVTDDVERPTDGVDADDPDLDEDDGVSEDEERERG
jgi:hypothetical protein